MALAAVVTSLDAVPEALKGEYAAGQDGKFYLNLEGGDALPFVAGLRTALDTERNTNKATKDAIAAWKKIGKTAEEIQELVDAKNAAETEASRKKGDFDAILKQHTTKWDGEKATLVSERDNALSFGRSAIVETSVMGALTKAKVTPTGVDLLTERLGRRVHLDISDGKRVVQILQADGKTPMAGTAPDGTATFDDLVKEAVKNFPELFEGTGAGGGGAPRKDAGGSGKTINRKDFEALSETDKRAKLKSGMTVVD